jgi:cyclopropane-fatty-acyl-phospholipid synthase
MSLPQQQVADRSYGSEPSTRRLSLFAAVLRRVLPRVTYGRLVIDAPAGQRIVLEGPQPGPHAHMKVHSWMVLWRVLARGDLGFAESYIAGDWSTPTLHEFIAFALRNFDESALGRTRLASRLASRFRHALNRNTRRGSRRNISAHYDLGNAFYAQWLDPGMSYSSGLYSTAKQTLESAQDAKLERVSELLDLSGGESVLEIGCGWGGLAEWLIGRRGCALTGVTLSERQLEFARERLRDRGLSGDLRLQDYRDVCGSYDRIVSIEMLEAVGEAYWPTYFAKVRCNLRPGGVAVLQVITIDETRFEDYRRHPDFIQRYIFPGGMLPTPAILQREINTAGLQLVTTEFFGDSYAQTLAEWQRRFQRAWPAIAQLGFDDTFKRTWEYYLAYCQAGFEAGTVNVGLYKLVRAQPCLPDRRTVIDCQKRP